MALPIGSPEKFGALLQTPQIAPTKGGMPQRPEGASEITSFGDHLTGFVKEVNSSYVKAGELSNAFAEGRNDDIHGTLIAMETAGIKMKLLATARNKAVQAYQQMMRMGS